MTARRATPGRAPPGASASAIGKRLAREPLTRFLALGGALFVVYALVQGGAGEAPGIDIDRYEVRRLATQWEAQWRRPPSPSELERLINERVREEVLYRQALALGLERGDAVVRRHLAQKLTVAWADLAAVDQPDEATLAAHYEATLERYRRNPELTLTHRFFSVAKRGAAARQDADAAVALLNTGEAVPDDPFRAAKALTLPDASRLAPDFGAAFRDAVAEAAHTGQVGRWFGPVRSVHGWHAVRIHAYEAGGQPSLAQVRDAVHLDWQQGHIEREQARRYAELRARYEVNVAPASDIPP